MIDASLTGFVVDVKVLEIVVKVDRSGTKVTPKKSRMSCEDGSDVDMSFTTKRNRQSGLPFVEMGNDSLSTLMRGKLLTVMSKISQTRSSKTQKD